MALSEELQVAAKGLGKKCRPPAASLRHSFFIYDKPWGAGLKPSTRLIPDTSTEPDSGWFTLGNKAKGKYNCVKGRSWHCEGMWSASTLTEVAHFGAVILLLLYCFYSPCVNIKISNSRYLLLLHISQGHWHPKCERLDLCLQAWSSITQLQTLSDAGRLTAKSGPWRH